MFSYFYHLVIRIVVRSFVDVILSNTIFIMIRVLVLEMKLLLLSRPHLPGYLGKTKQVPR